MMRAPERLASTIEALYASGSLEMLGMSSRESPNIDVAQPRHAIAVTAFLRSANNVTRVLTDPLAKTRTKQEFCSMSNIIFRASRPTRFASSVVTVKAEAADSLVLTFETGV
ncbi:hypothetical protein [Cupriavidus taiwanensis]|uniref:hypothetical protein n=1 Tax=Cupriavidus taiwanensis TaxID=164546 RepID=UPI000E2E64EA|nr:hypothetical protein [Cupriavidus taiwanensis]